MSIYCGCITRRKLNAITYNRVMDQLPENRTKPGDPSRNTGIDYYYAGPVTPRMGGTTKPVHVTVYLLVFQ